MTEFVLNNTTIKTSEPKGMTLLDFIRYHKRLTGTKIGCREGDCGACTVLIGTLTSQGMVYKSMTSCITPIANAHGKHVVTVEGLNMKELNPVQQAMVDHSGTQCGFCTPGFVVSLCGFSLSSEEVSYDNAISAIDGNICRCTGYKSIERAAQTITEKLVDKNRAKPIEWAVDNGFVPDYFNGIADRLQNIALKSVSNGQAHRFRVGGGTDLYVQRHDDLHHDDIDFVFDKPELNGISVKGNVCTIKAAATASDLLHSVEMQQMFPNLRKHLKLVSSTPIRNMGTVAGNFVNASPIGDLTAFFIALNTEIELANTQGNLRTVKLKDFYKGYKVLDKRDDEHIENIRFDVPDANTHFNFEKISKRTYLDIASVNSAMSVKVKDGVIAAIYLSGGGVGPTPMQLEKTCAFLTGKALSVGAVRDALSLIPEDISPISDARGTAEYKTLALRQLVYAHFMELFPETFKIEELV